MTKIYNQMICRDKTELMITERNKEVKQVKVDRHTSNGKHYVTFNTLVSFKKGTFRKNART